MDQEEDYNIDDIEMCINEIVIGEENFGSDIQDSISDIEENDDLATETDLASLHDYESDVSESTMAMTNSEGGSIIISMLDTHKYTEKNQEHFKDLSNNIILRPRRSITIKNEMPVESIEIKESKKAPVLEKRPKIAADDNLTIPDKYYEGSLLWGKLKSYPWWPCMIYRSPEGTYYRTNYIHVAYFGPKVERGWINVNDTFPYDGKIKYDEIVNKLIAENAPKKVLKDYCLPDSKISAWNKAWKEAELAISKKIPRRIKDHGIVYTGKNVPGQVVASDDDIDYSDNDDDSDYVESIANKSVHSNQSIVLALVKPREKRVTITPIKFEDCASIVNIHANEGGVSPLPTVVLCKSLEITPIKFEDCASIVNIHANEGGVSPVPTVALCKLLEITLSKFEDNGSSQSFPANESPTIIKKLANRKAVDRTPAKIEDNGSMVSVRSTTSASLTKKDTNRLAVNITYEYLNLKSPTFAGNKRQNVCVLCLGDNDDSTQPIKHCTGQCSQTFHRHCMQLLLEYLTSEEQLEAPTLDFEKCVDCNRNQRRCFMCRKMGNNGTKPDMIKCNSSCCGRYYHRDCLNNGVYHNLVTHNRHGSITCPSHTCHSCHLENPATVRHSSCHIRCIMCPAAFHKGDWCIPAGSKEINAFHIVCPQHLPKSGAFDVWVAPFMDCVKNGVVTLDRYAFKKSRFDDVLIADPWIIERPLRHSKSKPFNVTWCFICSKGGELICCEKCPASLHQNCAQIKEIPDTFICDECCLGKYPRYGEIFWLKVGSYRWWPAQIIHEKHAPTNVLNSTHGPGQFLVMFFGTKDFYWSNKTQAFMFDEGDDETAGCNDSSNSDSDASKQLLNKRTLDNAYRASLIAAGKGYRRRYKRWAELTSNGNKPTHYKTIKTNVPIGKVRISRAADVATSHQCECRPGIGKNDADPCGSSSECINRQLYYECNPAHCRNGKNCRNQRFMLRQYPKQEIFSTPDRGWALRVKEFIKRGEFVIEYVGEVIDEEEANRRLKTAHENNVTNFYMMELDGQRIIDAGPAANISRFMNHSCSPNVCTQRWMVNGDTRIGVFALYDIQPNEELTFNYNFLSLGQMKIPCKCGAKNCSGFLGVPPKAPSSSSSSSDMPGLVPENHVTKSQPKKQLHDRKTQKTKLELTSSANNNNGNNNTAQPVGPPAKKANVSSTEKEFVDSHCFVCQKAQCNLVCEHEICPRVYHRQCVDHSVEFRNMWWCPWHFCDDCGRLATSLCSYCTVSFCGLHVADRVQLNNGTMYCQNHWDTLHHNLNGSDQSPINSINNTNNQSSNTSTESPTSISI